MSTTNRMPKTTPWQAVQQIPIKSATIRQSETSLWHVHYYTTNRTNGDRAEQNSDRIGRKMSENDENLFPWQRPLRDSNQILQQSSTLVGLPAGEKTGKIVHILFEQIEPERVVKTGSSFGSQNQPRSLRMVPFDRRQNFLHFLCPRPCAYLASFLSYGEKMKFRKKKVGFHGSVPWKIKNRGSDWSSTATAEPNVKTV